MRLPEEQIKQAILHPDLDARTLALQYFTKSFTEDTTIMPLVIKAVEQYGREPSIPLIKESFHLPQTQTTIEWCIDELRHHENSDDSRYAYALSDLLTHADPQLTRTRESEILALPCFDRILAYAFSERIQLLDEDADSLWKKLFDFCESESDPDLYDMDLPHACRLSEALGRLGSEVADRVLELLNEEIDYSESSPRLLMQGFLLYLAGDLRLIESVPLLIESLKIIDDWHNEEAQRALVKIGGDVVVEVVVNEFPTEDWHFQISGSSVLENIHSDLAIQKSIELFIEEPDDTILPFLGQATLSHFSTDAIEPVCEFIRTTAIDPDVLSLRETLIAVSTVLGVEFPEYEVWKQANEEAESTRRALYSEQLGNHTFGFSGDLLVDLEEDAADTEIEPVTQPTYFPNTIVREEARIGRNDPCPCGSGKKYKKCCLNKS
ncbi:SEC-C metal-binding domain-containing protein [Gimesia fumaroli]|nr:SEC-C metal-binding domain-containing protein [Gimesia fumaroli]